MRGENERAVADQDKGGVISGAYEKEYHIGELRHIMRTPANEDLGGVKMRDRLYVRVSRI